MGNICLQLLYANSEQEVQNIIESDSDMRNPKNWYPLDGRDTNNNVIGNQSSDGGKAATELITNMVDAILTKECLKANIDPKSDKAPSTMYDAVDKFIKNLQGGKISQVDDEKWLKKYAEENLIIGLTGSRQRDPCFVFCDNGEGQYPENFTTTFLSLGIKNKSEIPFVQGKYNMGSSGVLNFCGDKWFKLILSRRYDGKKPWGWTLIRKNSPESGEFYAEYFSPDSVNNIQTINDVTIYPLTDLHGHKINNFSLNAGTIIKLYDYYAGRKISSFRETREIFNENLIESILPFRIYDCRQKPTKGKGVLREQGVDDRPFYGLEYLILRSYKEEEDKKMEGEENTDIEPERRSLEDVDEINHPNLGKISISAVVLKEKAGRVGWFKESKIRIFHHVNGQVQYKQSRGVLSDWKLGALMDRVVIFVDASYLKNAARKDIWKTDRENIKKTKLGKEYLGEVRKIIEESQVLKELHHRIAKEKMEIIAKDSSKEIVKDLLKLDKNFAALLSGDVPEISVPVEPRQPKEEKPRNDLQYEPSYIKFMGRSRSVETPINKARPIKCDTDAEDSFLSRIQNRGKIIFSNAEVGKKCKFTRSLKNGNLFVSVQSLEGEFQPGDNIKFKIGLRAMHQDVYTEDEMIITFTEPKPRTPHKSPKPRPPESRYSGLPKHALVTKDGRILPGDHGETEKWENIFPDFGGKDGGYVDDLGEEGKKYYVNYDNDYFQNSLRLAQNDAEKERIQNKFILGMRIFLLGMERSLALWKRDFSENHEGSAVEIQENIRRQAAAAAASVIIILSEGLPAIYNKDE